MYLDENHVIFFVFSGEPDSMYRKAVRRIGSSLEIAVSILIGLFPGHALQDANRGTVII
jgi:hypothetical protein